MLLSKLSSLQNVLERALYILLNMFFSIQNVLRMFASIFSPIKNVLEHAFAFYVQNVLKHVRFSAGVS